MSYLPKIAWISFLAAAFVHSSSLPVSAQTAQIRHVAAHKSGGSLQIEIETSKRVVPLTQVVTDPDRLVIDFADSVAGPDLRNIAVNSGEVKGIRIGRVTSNPPVTRVVVDLKSPQPFQLFPSSKSIVIKVGEGGTAVAQASAAPAAQRPTAIPQPAAEEAPHATTIQLSPLVPRQAKPASLRVAAAVPAPPAPTSAISITREPMGVGPNTQIRHVAVLKSGGATEIEIQTSQRVSPEVQAITGPDRLVIDFPQSTPGPQLRALAVNQGEVKGVRVALLSAKPPVTRVVLDLKSAQAYQVFPSAKSVIVKLPDSMGVGAGSMSSPQVEAVPETAQVPPSPPKVEVGFQDGRLRLVSNKASLAEVLTEVSLKTGAVIPLPPGADQENVVISAGPGTPREVMSQLLNGSAYNFIIVGKDEDANQIERIVLSAKTPGGVTYEQPNSSPPMEAQQRNSVPAPGAPLPQVEDVQPQGDSNPPPDPANPPPDTTPQPGDPQAAPN